MWKNKTIAHASINHGTTVWNCKPCMFSSNTDNAKIYTLNATEVVTIEVSETYLGVESARNS